MRDHRDAKVMAHTLREALTAKEVAISHSESLELVSRMLGVADWNTLSALIQADRQPSESGSAGHPAIPVRDIVPFPMMNFPLFVARGGTLRAIDAAFSGNREVVLAIQTDPGTEEPGIDNLYPIAVIANLLEIERLPDGATFKGRQLPDGSVKILVMVHRRVVLRRFTEKSGAFWAQIEDVCEGPIPSAPGLIQHATERFEIFAAANDVKAAPQILAGLGQIRDPGRIADAIAPQLMLPINEKQRILATIDPVARLEAVIANLGKNA